MLSYDIRRNKFLEQLRQYVSVFLFYVFFLACLELECAFSHKYPQVQRYLPPFSMKT